MKVVILAGGLGSRISEESHLKPKPMIEIGDKPILWHIMKIYHTYGFDDFIICAGYKGDMIKKYFSDYFISNCDVTFDYSADGQTIIHKSYNEKWKVTIVDTGAETMTGGRLKRVQEYIKNERFMLTYGDGVADVDIPKLLAFHDEKKTIGTITSVQPTGRFGVIHINQNDSVLRFAEKSQEDVDWINGGFMVFEPSIFDYINGDETILEREPLEKLVSENQLSAYKHHGFWQCMDTMRDKMILEEYWKTGTALWKKYR